MLRLRSCILTRLLSSSPSASPGPSLHRLLSAAAAAPAVSPNPSFAVEDYLVDTCGLTRAQALKASTKISRVKSPTKPDAVLAFLSVGLGLSSADIAAAVAKDPQLLCAKVDKTLRSNVAELTSLGLSRSEIARLLGFAGSHFRCRSIVSKLQYYLPFFGSFEKLQKVIHHGIHLIGTDPEKVGKPNVAFLRECGLSTSDIVNICIRVPRMLSTNPERVRAIAVRAEGLGVPRGSRMFRHALTAAAFLSKEKIACKVEYLKKMFRWSDAEAGIALSKSPYVLRGSKDMLRRRSEFLISELGLEPAYIARRPVILTYSLEGRLRPRYYVVKFLKENGLVAPNRDYYSTVKISEKVFLEKYICPHKEAAPHLAEDYAAACRGEVPTRFRFT